MENLSRIVRHAYPSTGPRSREAVSEYADRLESRADDDDRLSYHGLFRDGELLGGLMLNDFRMNLRGRIVPALGVSLVAVDLAHKRRHVCKQLMQHVLERAEADGYALTTLYPFRPDFYRRMGFGFGSPVYELDLDPAQFPRSPLGERVRLLDEDSAREALDLYQRLFRTTSGLFEKRLHELARPLAKGKTSLAAYGGDGGVEGYAMFRFGEPEGGNFLRYDLEVLELLYDGPDALQGLLAFLGTQSDQVRRIRLLTHEAGLFHRFDDPTTRSGRLLPRVNHPVALMGAGVMYRFTDPGEALSLIGAGPGPDGSAPVELVVEDDFVWEAPRSVAVRAADGKLVYTDAEPEGRLTMRIDAFSSVVAGSATLAGLAGMGMVRCRGGCDIAGLSRALEPDAPPVCLTGF
jgi:predicted acetyltransferase